MSKTRPQCEIVVRSYPGDVYAGECKTHAIRTPAVSYDVYALWWHAHLRHKCQCGHSARSHGDINVWRWHEEYGLPAAGACGTCKCGGYQFAP